MSAAYRCFASCAFGLEAVMARELKDLRFNDIAARDARVYFLADEAGIARANLWLRTADRVYIELAVFPAVTFDELFEGVRALRWSDYVPKDAAFVVNADSAHSRLVSVSDIQSVGKKAVAVSLMKGHRVPVLPETGVRYDIHLKLLRDTVSVCLQHQRTGAEPPRLPRGECGCANARNLGRRVGAAVGMARRRSGRPDVRFRHHSHRGGHDWQQHSARTQACFRRRSKPGPASPGRGARRRPWLSSSAPPKRLSFSLPTSIPKL
jgi:hypothetical protein